MIELKEVITMDMYQKRKMRKEKKMDNNNSNNVINKIVINWLITI